MMLILNGLIDLIIVESFIIDCFIAKADMYNKVKRDKSPIIIHYHYHYYNEPLPQKHYPSKIEHIKRFKSDGKIKIQNFNQQKAETDSNASHSSWKRFVKPELQSSNTTTPKSYEHIQIKGSQTAKKPHSQTSFGQVSQFKLHLSKNAESKQRNYSSIIPINSNTSFSQQSGFKQTFDQTPKSMIQNMELNPESRKNRFMKKRQVQILPARALFEQKGQQVRSQQYKDYRYRNRLIQEQCTYLRQKFLSHYISQHPEGTFK